MLESEILALIGGGILVALGLLGLFRPQTAAKLVGITPIGALGISEVRATYGGLFVGMGLVCLLTQAPAAFLAAACASLGAALARTLSVLVDKSTSPKNLAGIIFELLLAGLLMTGALQ